jgi:hypothetical protein
MAVQASQGNLVHMRQLQQEPNVRTRTGPAVPPPLEPLCLYGDPFRKPGAGGCCQACKQAHIRYNCFRDSDMDKSASILLD